MQDSNSLFDRVQLGPRTEIQMPELSEVSFTEGSSSSGNSAKSDDSAESLAMKKENAEKEHHSLIHEQANNEKYNLSSNSKLTDLQIYQLPQKPRY